MKMHYLLIFIFNLILMMSLFPASAFSREGQCIEDLVDKLNKSNRFDVFEENSFHLPSTEKHKNHWLRRPDLVLVSGNRIFVLEVKCAEEIKASSSWRYVSNKHYLDKCRECMKNDIAKNIDKWKIVIGCQLAYYAKVRGNIWDIPKKLLNPDKKTIKHNKKIYYGLCIDSSNRTEVLNVKRAIEELDIMYETIDVSGLSDFKIYIIKNDSGSNDMDYCDHCNDCLDRLPSDEMPDSDSLTDKFKSWF